jgi:hypothetical protein
MRDRWFETMGRPDSPQAQETFPPLPQLEPMHTANARLLPARRALLELLPAAGRIAEIGTYDGGSAEQILRVCQPTEMHLFDLDFGPLRARPQVAADKRVTLHQGDSSAMLSALPDRHFSWIYVDGDHSYAGVMKDIGVACRKVAADGLLVFNDYIYWSYLDQVPYGVPHAVNELCVKDGWEIVFLVLQERMYCDVVVRRRADQVGFHR